LFQLLAIKTKKNATKNASKYAKAIFIYNIANIAIENWVSESMSIHLHMKNRGVFG
jgi:competence protein ComGF